MSKTQVNIDNDKLQVASEILRAINHKLRMKILEFIDQNDKINVNKIYNTLNLEQSITSQHLRILRNAGVVDTQRDGKFIYYEINYNRVNQAIESIDNNFNTSACMDSFNSIKISGAILKASISSNLTLVS